MEDYGLQNQRRLHRLWHLCRCLPGECHFGRRRQVCNRCGRVPGLRHVRRRVPRKRDQRGLIPHRMHERRAGAHPVHPPAFSFCKNTARNELKCMCFADMIYDNSISCPSAGEGCGFSTAGPLRKRPRRFAAHVHWACAVASGSFAWLDWENDTRHKACRARERACFHGRNPVSGGNADR